MHDIYGASLRMLDSMNSGTDLSDASKILGRQNCEGLEQTLPEDVIQTLLEFVIEAIDKIDKIRLTINKTFKINSEVIWLSIIGEAKRSGSNEMYEKINLISPNDFSRIVIFVREKLTNEKRRIELSY